VKRSFLKADLLCADGIEWMKRSSPTESSGIVRGIAEMTEKLDPIPHIATKIMEVVGDSEATCERLSEVISKDPGLTSRILGLSNTPYYRRVESITSLNLAVMILGFGAIQSLVLTIAVGSLFRNTDSRETIFNIWRHSLATALISERLGKRLGFHDREQCYIGGLLHDVGKLVFCKRFPDKFKQSLDTAIEKDIPYTKAEQEAFGFDHAQLGKAVLEKWNLPEVYHLPVAAHHQEECYGSTEPLCIVVHVADCMAHGILKSENEPEWIPSPVALERLELGETEVSEFVAQEHDLIAENLESIAGV
jgi:putative nucleotidyltransferase with HDIG domain